MNTRVAILGALSLILYSCGDSDTPRKHENASGSAVENGEGPDDGVAGNTREHSGAEAEGDPIDTDTAFVDANVAFDRDAGFEGSPPSSGSESDAAAVSLESAALGRAYAESEFVLQQPAALQGAFGTIATATGDTRLLVTEPYVGDAGVEVRYGAADLIDGGLIWQKPPASPRSFALAASEQNGQTLISAPFGYILEARVALTPTKAFRLYLEAEQVVFRATFNADFTEIVSGELRGVLTRPELERRPLDLATCILACGAAGLSACTQSEVHLAAAFDCNGQKPDVDTNGDGVLDGYRLVVSFKSREVTLPRQ